MGLNRLLARAGAQRLHVLLVEGDDAFVLRAAAERACLARGWVLALSPADADVMLACCPRPAVVSDAVDAVFAQLPGPRARAELWHERHLEAVLDQLHTSYLHWPNTDTAHSDQTSPNAPARHGVDAAAQGGYPAEADAQPVATHTDPHACAGDDQAGDDRASAGAGQEPPATPRPGVEPLHDPYPDDEPTYHLHDMHAAHDDSIHDEQDEQEGHDNSTRDEQDDHEGHEMRSGHDMHSGHGMDMAGPGGVALASGAPDRDGLEMDRLHVQLGPVLASWPAGLVVWCTLAGDVVTQVDVVQPALDRKSVV